MTAERPSPKAIPSILVRRRMHDGTAEAILLSARPGASPGRTDIWSRERDSEFLMDNDVPADQAERVLGAVALAMERKGGGESRDLRITLHPTSDSDFESVARILRDARKAWREMGEEADEALSAAKSALADAARAALPAQVRDSVARAVLDAPILPADQGITAVREVRAVLPDRSVLRLSCRVYVVSAHELRLERLSGGRKTHDMAPHEIARSSRLDPGAAQADFRAFLSSIPVPLPPPSAFARLGRILRLSPRSPEDAPHSEGSKVEPPSSQPMGRERLLEACAALVRADRPDFAPVVTAVLSSPRDDRELSDRLFRRVVEPCLRISAELPPGEATPAPLAARVAALAQGAEALVDEARNRRSGERMERAEVVADVALRRLEEEGVGPPRP